MEGTREVPTPAPKGVRWADTESPINNPIEPPRVKRQVDRVTNMEDRAEEKDESKTTKSQPQTGSTLRPEKVSNDNACHVEAVGDKMGEPSGIYDSGATSGVAAEKDAKYLLSTGEKSMKMFVIPNSESMAATEKLKLPFDMREPATEMNLVPGVHSTLISACKTADAGYITVLDKDELNIYDGRTTKIIISEEAVLKGYRCKQSGLWRIPLKKVVNNENTDTLLIQRPAPQEAIAHVFELPSTEKTIAYFHAAAGFPTKETWITAVRAGNYITWPGLTVKAVQKYFPESDETLKGHMKGQCQGLRSTKEKEESTTSLPIEPKKKQHEAFVKVVDLKETMYTDQTGKFPYLSSKGNRYIMVGYHTDANYIFLEPMKNRTELQMIGAYQRIMKRMKAAGLGVKKHILDNEVSKEFKEAIKNNKATHELVPPGEHRRNVAERAIQTAKNHFVGVLAGVHDTFPMHLWCRLLPQAEWQLNLQRQSNVTPKISAYAHVHGPHNFMAKPFAPLGCPVQAYEKPDKRGSWSEHSIDAWNIGTSLEHHRCFGVYNKHTRAERIAETLFFKHQYLTSPTVSPADRVVEATQQLAKAVEGSAIGESQQMEDLRRVAKMFNDIAKGQAKKEKELQPKNNGIKTYPIEQEAVPPPRVKATAPRAPKIKE